MSPDSSKTVQCQICGESKPLSGVLPLRLVRDAVAQMMRKEHPSLADDGYVCLTDVNLYRMQRVKQLVADEVGGLSAAEMEVVKSLEKQQVISTNVNQTFEGKLTAGQRVADRVAEFGGSWPFIITFGAILLVWIVFNSIGLMHRPFDPTPSSS